MHNVRPWTQLQPKLCQTIAPLWCFKTPQLSSTCQPTIAYTPDHSRKNDWVSTRLTSVQTMNVCTVSLFLCPLRPAKHGCHKSWQSHNEWRWSQHTTPNVHVLVLQHNFEKHSVKVVHCSRVGSNKHQPKVEWLMHQECCSCKTCEHICAMTCTWTQFHTSIASNNCRTWVLERPTTI